MYIKYLSNYFPAKDKRLQIVHTLGECPEKWEGEEGFIDTGMIDKHVIKPNGIKHKVNINKK